VRSTAAGKVLYSGEGSPGYEQLVVIEHPGGWVSSYSHNRKRLVAEGQTVAAGAVIAEMGHTGAGRDMVHFELRRAGQLVDPRTVLPPR
jgi:lipoprotein NlpD